jgi:hypothetical protein
MLRSAAQLDAALARVVGDDGRVDYVALQADDSALACARDLAQADLHQLQSREQQLAFWINAYNCLALVGVLKRLQRNPSYRGVMHGGVLGALRFFYLDRYVVGEVRAPVRYVREHLLAEFEAVQRLDVGQVVFDDARLGQLRLMRVAEDDMREQILTHATA